MEIQGLKFEVCNMIRLNNFYVDIYLSAWLTLSVFAEMRILIVNLENYTEKFHANIIHFD